MGYKASAHSFGTMILSVAFMAGFIAILFFTYVLKIEHHAVQSEVERLAAKVGGAAVFLPDRAKQLLHAAIAREAQELEQSQAVKDADAAVEASNAAVRAQGYRVVGITVAVAAVAAFGIARTYDVPLRSIVISALEGAVAAGITEFLFATFYAAHFKIVDTNSVVRGFIDRISQKLA